MLVTCKSFSAHCLNQALSKKRKLPQDKDHALQSDDLSEKRTSGSSSTISSEHAAVLEDLKQIFLDRHATQVTSGASVSTGPSRKKMKLSIKNFFTSSHKFAKAIKHAGVYLTSVLVCGDQVLVTSDEVLPTIQIDTDDGVKSLSKDLPWLGKLGSAWEEVETMLRIVEHNTCIPPKIAFRVKVLEAVSKMQMSLGVQDLGLIYPSPFKNQTGSQVLVTVHRVRDMKEVSSKVKWIPLDTLQRKVYVESTEKQIRDAIPDLKLFEKTSQESLPAGLYLAYLKLQSGMNSIKFLVQDTAQNMLPHLKIRDNPKVTSNEWACITSLTSEDPCPASSEQRRFKRLLAKSSSQMLANLNIKEDTAIQHRLYPQVISLNQDVSIIVLIPPVTDVCTGPGQTNELGDRPGYLSVPINTFEQSNLITYQCSVAKYYSPLSCALEIESHICQQAQREAFSKEEMQVARTRTELITGHQSIVEEAYNGVRWTSDVIRYARDKKESGILVTHLHRKLPHAAKEPMQETVLMWL